MAVNPSSLGGPKPQFELSDGTPAVGNRLFFYVAGSVGTKQNTYTDSTGGSANTNPIVLNALGMPTTEIWFTAGQSYKVVYAPPGSDDPPSSPIFTVDNLRGINDTSVTIDQWVASGITPTFVSATSFTLPGDQTSEFHVGRQLESINTGGTVYSVITASVFGALTTVTVANYAGASLDSGLSAVSYGLITAVNPSINADMVNRKAASVASAATTNIWGTAGDFVHVTGSTGPITSLGTAPYAGVQRTVIFDSTPTITHNATSLILPGGANITAAAGDRMVVRADTTANMVVIDYTKASGQPVVSSVLRAYKSGLTLSAAGGSASMGISAGIATDSTNVAMMSLASAITKTTSAWSVGTGNGGLDTGVIANSTWYAFYAINRPDTNVTDVIFSTNGTSPSMPANYTLLRRIGWGLTDGSAQWVAFTQYGDEFWWTVPVNDVNAQATATANRTARTLTAAPSTMVIADVYYLTNGTGVNEFCFLSSADMTDNAASVTNFTLAVSAATNPEYGSGEFRYQLNSSRQMYDRGSAAGTVGYMTKAWIDRCGRE